MAQNTVRAAHNVIRTQTQQVGPQIRHLANVNPAMAQPGIARRLAYAPSRSPVTTEKYARERPRATARNAVMVSCSTDSASSTGNAIPTVKPTAAAATTATRLRTPAHGPSNQETIASSAMPATPADKVIVQAAKPAILPPARAAGRPNPSPINVFPVERVVIAHPKVHAA